MNAEQPLLAEVVAILEAVLDGKVDALTALRRWPEMSANKNRMILDARHRLDHYASDADIHKTNFAYEKKQRKLLEESLGLLKGKIR